LSLTLFTCGICSSDTALKDCVLLTELKDEIDASEIKTMFLEMLSPLNDCNAKQSAINFALAVQFELVDGILKDAKYCCNRCSGELSKMYKIYCKSNSVSGLTNGLSYLSVNQASQLFESEATCNSRERNAQPDELLASMNDSKRRVPKLALVNGHFRGATPLCLSRLTRVELSMVVRINCVYTLTMLKKGEFKNSQFELYFLTIY
jgi:hypothetical protein